MNPILFLFNYHIEISVITGSIFRERIKLWERLREEGYKVKEYYHCFFKPDYTYPILFRVWVEFDTQEELIEFKLRYL
jgi:hypothetical protein